MEETKAEAMFQSLWYMSGSDENDNKEGMEDRNFRGMSFEGRRIIMEIGVMLNGQMLIII